MRTVDSRAQSGRAAGAPLGPRATKPRRATAVSASPAAAPTRARSRLSTRSWRISRPRPAPRAERTASLPGSSRGSRQQQVGHVRARDEQDPGDRREEQQQRPADVRHHPRLEGAHVHVPSSCWCRDTRVPAARRDAVARSARAASTDTPCSRRAIGPQKVRAGAAFACWASGEARASPRAQPDARGNRTRGGMTADDGVRLVVEGDGAADDLRPRAEAASPQAVAQHDERGIVGVAARRTCGPRAGATPRTSNMLVETPSRGSPPGRRCR